MNKKISICVDVEDLEEVKLAETWINENKKDFSHLTQSGCGCCVLIWDIETKDKIVSTLPEELSGVTSDWSEGEN